jgi:S1-C subfamily serine protease
MKKISLILGALMLALAGSVLADEQLAAAKKIFADKQDSVVWVSAVATISFSSAESKDSISVPDQESKMESLATIVDTNGVAVTVLSQLDPSRNINGRSVRTANGSVKVEAATSLKEVKVTLADGTEIPADVVLKDINLDLAIIRIQMDSKEAKGATFPAVDLKDSATGKVLDDVVTLTRMDEVFNRAPTVYYGQINMITKKPRVFLRATGATGGCPTFNTDGKIIGITSGRFVKGRQPAAAIIPAADVLEVLGQLKPANSAK